MGRLIYKGPAFQKIYVSSESTSHIYMEREREYEKLIHIIVETEKFYDLPSARRRCKKCVVFFSQSLKLSGELMECILVQKQEKMRK